MNLTRQSEHSGLRPDTSGLVEFVLFSVISVLKQTLTLTFFSVYESENSV